MGRGKPLSVYDKELELRKGGEDADEYECARTVAVVVPSPAKSDDFDATSRTICAPIFSNLSSS